MEFYKINNGIKSAPSDVYSGIISDKHLSLYFNGKYMFDREVAGINLLSGKPYAPIVTEIDESKFLVVYEYENNLNHMLYSESQPADWLQQVKYIQNDLEKSGLFRVNFFQHPFVYVKDRFCLIDNYGMANVDEKIPKQDVYHFINDPSRFPFEGDFLDIKSAYEMSIKMNIGNWPDSFFE